MSRRGRACLAALLIGGLTGGALSGGACSCDEEEGGEVTPEPGAPELPSTAEGRATQLDLLATAHLADFYHEGLQIDFGTPARHKYTVGRWNSGFGADQRSGEGAQAISYTRVGETARVYFPAERRGALTLRFRMRPVGSRRMMLFLNGAALEGVQLEEDERAMHDYDVAVPESAVHVGENYLLLRFGGAEVVEGERVSVDLEALQIIEGSVGDEGHPRVAWRTLRRSVEAGGRAREALALPGHSRLAFHAEVPEDGHLIFGLATQGALEGARAKVVVTPEGGEATELFSEEVGATWSDQGLSLERWEGQVVRIDLVTEGSGEGRVAFSNAAIMVPAREERELRQARNVVVLLIDTLRASKLQAYNPRSRVQTPILSRVAEQGTVFEQAQSAENWTKPSCASVLTGLTPMTHRAKTSEARLPESAEMVSEAFQEAGFATGSFIANGYVSDHFGFDQGWDHYTNFIRENKSTEAEAVFREAGDFIEQHREERFFVYIQTIDPHVPYDPPDEFLRRYDARADYEGPIQPRQTAELLEEAKRIARVEHRNLFNASDQRRLEALHDAEISYHDHWLGQFLERLERLGVRNNTLLVVTSDHGEEFQDHGSYGHGHSVYQELISVPLIFNMPRNVPAQRLSHTVSTLNIAQTILEAAGVEGLSHAEGRSLWSELAGGVPQGPQVAFSDWQEIRRVARAGRYKLILRQNLSTVFFDLGADPGERHEREVRDFPIAGRYTRILLSQYLGATNRGQWLRAEQAAGQELSSEDAEMDDTTRAQLRALGYAN